jgi:hypothetical protein
LRPTLSSSDFGAAGKPLISQQSEIANVMVLALTDPHPVHSIHSFEGKEGWLSNIRGFAPADASVSGGCAKYFHGGATSPRHYAIAGSAV